MQVYQDARGREVREYRAPEEVFSEAALATLGGIPVTIGHPGAVNASNWRDVARGHVSEGPVGRRADGPGVEWLEQGVVVSDAQTLAKVDAGELVELSLGYTADVVHDPGVAPDGTAYTHRQTNIRYNHLALLQDGRARAGRGARLRLDSKGDEMSQFRQDDAARRIKVDGIDCDYGSETHVQMLERRAEQAVKRADEAEAKAAADAKTIGELKAKIDAAPKALDAAAVDRLVQDELSFRDSMRPALAKDYAFAGKSREQIRLDAVGPEVAAKVAALPEAQREGYLLCAVQQRLDAADKPTHQPDPTKVLKADSAPAKYDPYKIFADTHKATFAAGKA